VADDSRQLESDLRIALLTGAAGWRDRNSNYGAAEMAVVAVLAANVAAVIMVLIVSAGLPARGAAWTGASRWVAAAVGSATLLAAITPTVAWPLVRRHRPVKSILPRALVRVVAAMTVAGCWTVLLGAAAPWPAWILGSVVGGEVVLTGWLLGIAPSGRQWWWRLESSSIHMGILAVSGLVLVARPDSIGDLALALLTFQAIAAGTGLTCAGLNWLRGVIELRTEKKAEVRVAAAHNAMAAWVHDELLTKLRLIRLHMEGHELGLAEAKLTALDHDLRVRQLEEVMTGGSAELADLFVPYLQLARDHGIELVEVPGYEESHFLLESQARQRVQRALGVLIPNAIAAGAGSLRLRVRTDPTGVAIEIEDDAGGFDLAEVPAGRGLDRLRRELGVDGLTRAPVNGGSLMRVRVESTAAAAAPSAAAGEPSAGAR
jgi:hypothetical protein